MPLGEASVVQCSKTAHTLLQHPGTIMDRLPTLLIVVPPASEAALSFATTQLPGSNDGNLQLSVHLNNALQLGIESGLPLALVAPSSFAAQARKIIPGNCIVELSSNTKINANDHDGFCTTLATGILSWPNANGWIVLAANSDALRSATLANIATAMTHKPIVYTQKKNQRCTPIGFAAEFFSELIRIHSTRDLNRLISRYPSCSIDIDEAFSPTQRKDIRSSPAHQTRM